MKSLRVRSLGGRVLAEVQGRRVRGKTSPRAVWTRLAFLAQKEIAASERMPLHRVAIVANNLEGTEATAVFSTAPPEVSLEPWTQKAPTSAVEGIDTDALVVGLLAFAWERMQPDGSRSFRFEADDVLTLEGLWFSDSVKLLVTTAGQQTWIATIKSEQEANADGLTDELASATAGALRRQPVGVLNGDREHPVRLCVS
jgi:hypothetical protein